MNKKLVLPLLAGLVAFATLLILDTALTLSHSLIYGEVVLGYLLGVTVAVLATWEPSATRRRAGE